MFAAASLKGALDEVVARSGRDVAVSYAGSGLIARQVAMGAPADLVILASADWMGWLADQNGVAMDAPRDLLGNRLVLIVPTASDDLDTVNTETLLERLGGGRMATGLTTSVPAGIYARQWLTRAGLWEALSPHLAETDNVRAALALVARKEAPLGVVYATDAKAEPRVRVIYEVPEDLHDPIRYPMAVIHSRNVSEVSQFAEFLLSDDAGSIFASHGFELAGDGP